MSNKGLVTIMDAADLILADMQTQGRSLEPGPIIRMGAALPTKPSATWEAIMAAVGSWWTPPELMEIEGVCFYLRHYSFKMSVRAWCLAKPYDPASMAAAILFTGVASDHLGEKDFFSSKEDALAMVNDLLCGQAVERLTARLWTLNNGIFPVYVFQKIDPATLLRITPGALSAAVMRPRLAGLLPTH